MVIRGLVKKDFETVGPYEGTYTIKNTISSKGAVVVMEEGAYVGVVTADDLLTKSYNLVIDCISAKPSIAPSQSILEALDLMKQSNIRVLPVYDNEAFIGLIHYSDILDYLSKIIEDQKMIVQTVAHDLRSPIANILGLTSLLKNNLVKEENKELIFYTEQACNYATEIINDLLLIPQLEGDQDERIDFELVDINSFIRLCVEGVQVLAESKQILLVDEIPSEPVYYPIHKHKFKRALHNILANAIKFTPSNGYVNVSTVKNINSILIKIKDSGIGIPQSSQPFIFSKFTKAKRTGTNGEQSIGLGLFITKQIIELHNGQLWFENNDKTGTTFYINLALDNSQDYMLSNS